MRAFTREVRRVVVRCNAHTPRIASVPKFGRPMNFCGMSSDSFRMAMDDINDKFVEARDEIEYAMESAETTYFDEEAEAAKEAVQSTFDAYNTLLASLPEEEKQQLQRSNGLKMEQLKAELQQMMDLHH